MQCNLKKNYISYFKTRYEIDGIMIESLTELYWVYGVFQHNGFFLQKFFYKYLKLILNDLIK